jgi:hypothetical protein
MKAFRHTGIDKFPLLGMMIAMTVPAFAASNIYDFTLR